MLDNELREIETALADNYYLYRNGTIDEESYRYNKEKIEKKKELVLAREDFAEKVKEPSPTKRYWELSFGELMQLFDEPHPPKIKVHCQCKEISPEEYTQEDRELVELNESLNATYTR